MNDTTPAASGAAPADVPYDDCLNDLGWKMEKFLTGNGAKYDGRVFNNMKGFLRDCITEWLAAHPAALASPQVAPEHVWSIRRYGSEPEKGYTIVAKRQGATHGDPVAFLGDGPVAGEAAQAICDAHNLIESVCEGLRSILKRKTDAAPVQVAPAPALSTCNCRWNGDERVQQCELHQAWQDTLHERAEEVRDLRKALATPMQAPAAADDARDALIRAARRIESGEQIADLFGRPVALDERARASIGWMLRAMSSAPAAKPAETTLGEGA